MQSFAVVANERQWGLW